MATELSFFQRWNRVKTIFASDPKAREFETQYLSELQNLKAQSDEELRAQCREKIDCLRTFVLSEESQARARQGHKFESALNKLYACSAELALTKKSSVKKMEHDLLAENFMVLNRTVLVLEGKLPVEDYLRLSDYVSGKGNKYLEMLGYLVFAIGVVCYVVIPSAAIAVGAPKLFDVSFTVSVGLVLIGSVLMMCNESRDLSREVIEISDRAKEVEKLSKQKVIEMRNDINPETTVEPNGVELGIIKQPNKANGVSSPETDVPEPVILNEDKLPKFEENKLSKHSESTWLKLLLAKPEKKPDQQENRNLYGTKVHVNHTTLR